MTRWARGSGRGRTPRLSAELRERETVKPLELFFDLVFVLGFTQCTALMTDDPSWTGVVRAMAVLTILWWAWTAYAWLTSVVDPEEGSVRFVMFAAIAGLLIMSICVPEAFGDRAVPFVVAYGIVRAAHLGLYKLASRDDPMLRSSVTSFAISTTIAVALLLVAAFLDGWARGALWVLAIAIDGGGPALVGIRSWARVEHMEGWRLVPAHFAERHNLVIILALGESIVALGIAAAEPDLSVGLYVAIVLGTALASAVWWIYFDVVALITQLRLIRAAPGRERNMLARDSYSYLHFPMVAGIVLVAFGMEVTVAHVDEELDVVPAFALLGGVAIYLLAHVALRWRNAHSLNRQRLLLAVLLGALVVPATWIRALATLAVLDVLIWLMIAYENHTYDERRYRLRHGLDPETPT
jgi:low temperature requirement protein LtrA